jgi:hypothetical protein
MTPLNLDDIVADLKAEQHNMFVVKKIIDERNEYFEMLRRLETLLAEKEIEFDALKAEREKDKDRLDWLSAILRSDNVEVGIALYAGSKLVDTVCKHLVWVSSFSGCGIDNDYFDFDDDFGDGLTLREAIDAAIAQQKGNHE